ncbi:MAG: polymerase, beta-like protein region protein [candidate division TM6 bacterium GW2011_GWF2_30_66]|nr:MAG: polymerase, beta-like protein region protein [candidate division TM6 bacterium GW2011_GWF2_30_66]
MALENEYKEKLLGILTILFPDAKIYLFGSRVGDNHAKYADVDVAIDENEAIRPGRIGEAINMLAESSIPYKVDIVDYKSVSKDMQYFIKRDGVIWKS